MAEFATANQSRCVPVWPNDALRIAFGAIWAIDATLKWLPRFRSTYMDTIRGMADGRPTPPAPTLAPVHSLSPEPRRARSA